MDWLYILFVILTFALIVLTVRKYWRKWPTRVEDKLEKIDKRLGGSYQVGSLEGGLNHEEKGATG